MEDVGEWHVDEGGLQVAAKRRHPDGHQSCEEAAGLLT